jgi:hypothetical protein
VKTKQTQYNLSIFQLAKSCRELTNFVFESLGKDSTKTAFETFKDISSLSVNSTTTGFFSFRNEELFYWIFMKFTHSSETGGSQSLNQEFEIQIKKAEVTKFYICAEAFESGTMISLLNPQALKILEIGCENDFSEFAETFTQKLLEKPAF